MLGAAAARSACPQGGPLPSLEVLVWAKAGKEVSLLANAWLAEGLERQRASREVVLLVRALGAQCAQAKGPPWQAVAKRLLRQQDDLFVCVPVVGVPADKTLAERSLRPLVVSRTIRGGTRSPQGSPTRVTVTRLFQTWPARGLHPLHAGLPLLQTPFPHV